MKIVVNRCYGGFSLSTEAMEALNLDSPYASVERTDERLIRLIEEGENAGGMFAKLAIVAIPDEATDWEIDEYDGFEKVTYVVGGKIFHK